MYYKKFLLHFLLADDSELSTINTTSKLPGANSNSGCPRSTGRSFGATSTEISPPPPPPHGTSMEDKHTTSLSPSTSFSQSVELSSTTNSPSFSLHAGGENETSFSLSRANKHSTLAGESPSFPSASPSELSLSTLARFFLEIFSSVPPHPKLDIAALPLARVPHPKLDIAPLPLSTLEGSRPHFALTLTDRGCRGISSSLSDDSSTGFAGDVPTRGEMEILGDFISFREDRAPAMAGLLMRLQLGVGGEGLALSGASKFPRKA